MQAFGDLAPAAVLIIGTMSSMYLGFATATEAAAVGCAFVMLAAKLWARFDLSVLTQALKATALTSGNIMFIVFAAFLFSYAISLGGVGEKLTALLVTLKLSKLEFMLALLIFFTILGALVESLGMIVITVPLLYPVLLSYGIDPIWFGIVLVIFIEMGQITPPIGINLFVLQSLGSKLKDVVWGAMPFHGLMFVMLGLLMLWPDIALWLPRHMIGK
jgi:C4-dicarboxylate transporter, DctM subunit